MTVDPSAVVIAIGMVVGGLVWLVRLEGRINVTDVRYGEIISRLRRIEEKQDHE